MALEEISNKRKGLIRTILTLDPEPLEAWTALWAIGYGLSPLIERWSYMQAGTSDVAKVDQYIIGFASLMLTVGVAQVISLIERWRKRDQQDYVLRMVKLRCGLAFVASLLWVILAVHFTEIGIFRPAWAYFMALLGELWVAARMYTEVLWRYQR